MTDAHEADKQPFPLDAEFYTHRKSGSLKHVPAPVLEGAVADTHCHLSMVPACDIALARAAVHKVDFICCMTDPTDDTGAVLAGEGGWRLAAGARLDQIAPGQFLDLPRLRFSVGVHPHNAKDYTTGLETGMLARLADARVCCLGEVGLDYHYDLSPRDTQRAVFRRQVQLAHRTGLPLALHIREAHEDALAIMDEVGFPAAGTILHCCTIGPSQLAPWIERGCYVAFGGALTFTKLDDVRESAALVPADKLLLETDAPYMAPVPLRGIDCGPEYIIFTADMMCAVRGATTPDERRALLAQIHANTLSLLDREPTEWQRREGGRV